MSHVQPAALQVDRSLRHAPTPISPQHSYKGYLGGIFASALTNGEIGHIPRVRRSCLLWCGFRFPQEDTMWSMHQGIHQAYVDSPHNVQGTIKALNHMSYNMPAKKCIPKKKVQYMLERGGVHILGAAGRGDAARVQANVEHIFCCIGSDVNRVLPAERMCVCASPWEGVYEVYR